MRVHGAAGKGAQPVPNMITLGHDPSGAVTYT